MDVENQSGKEVVYTAADGGPAAIPLFVRIFYRLRALFLRVRVNFFGASPNWCVGKSCWGMLDSNHGSHKLTEPDSWGQCRVTAIVFDGFWPYFLSEELKGIPGKICIVPGDAGGYEIKADADCS